MKKPVVVIGEVMLDAYIYGKVERISPEAPVPVLKKTKEEYRIGGAGNVANNIVSLGEEVCLISLIGNDNNGNILKKLCEKKGINAYFLNDGRETILKQRFVAEGYKQQLLRFDIEQTYPIDNQLSDKIIEKINEIDPEIIVISDYAKGLITPYLMENIKKKYINKKILVDPKPKNIDLYKGVYLIKPNFKEAKEIINEDIENTDEDIEKIGKKLVNKYNSNFVITRSEKGATLITKKGEIYHYHPKAKEVFDVSGAGDTFIATIAFGLNNGYSLKKSVKLANYASSIVVGKFGTSTISKEELFSFVRENEKSNIS